MSTYREKHSLEDRRRESAKILLKYPDRVPVLVELHPSTTRDIALSKRKYLVPYDLSFAQFMYVLRKHTKLAPDAALFMFVNGRMPAAAALVGATYSQSKSDDGFLEILLSGESVFGQ